MSYEHFRAVRIASEGAMPSMLHRGQVINNTGNSRQVRRARERDRERGPVFSDRLAYALSQIEPGMGLFSYSPMSPTTGRRVKRYRAAYLSERMPASETNARRYQALFPMSESPEVHQGQAGAVNQEETLRPLIIGAIAATVLLS